MWADIKDKSAPAIEEIKKKAEEVFENDEGLAKKVSLYLCHRYSGRKLKEIGGYFGLGESGVSQASRRVRMKIEADKKLRRKVKDIEKRIGL